MTDRAEFRQLSRLRQEDAKALIDAGRWAGSYYLMGYAVECALKACIMQRFKRHALPERKLVNDVYSHELDRLLKLAELDDALRAEQRIYLNWVIVKDWSEQIRYLPRVEEHVAREMFQACTRPREGVLPWLRKRW